MGIHCKTTSLKIAVQSYSGRSKMVSNDKDDFRSKKIVKNKRDIT